MRKYKDAEATLEAVRQDGLALRDVPEDLKTEAVCLAAVQQYGQALKFVPKERKTPEVCLEAVKQDGRALKFVPAAQKTETVCIEAMNGRAGTACRAFRGCCDGAHGALLPSGA